MGVYRSTAQCGGDDVGRCLFDNAESVEFQLTDDGCLPRPRRSRDDESFHGQAEAYPTGSVSESLTAVSNTIHFNLDICHKLANDRSPNRLILAKEFRINLIHLREVRAIRQIHSNLNHLRHGRPDAIQNDFQIIQNLTGLMLNVALLRGHLPGNKNKSASFNRR